MSITRKSSPAIRPESGELGNLLTQLRAVDVVQVQACWTMGRHTAEFGPGFDPSSLRYLRIFYQAFPSRDALRHQLNWTRYRTSTPKPCRRGTHRVMRKSGACDE